MARTKTQVIVAARAADARVPPRLRLAAIAKRGHLVAAALDASKWDICRHCKLSYVIDDKSSGCRPSYCEQDVVVIDEEDNVGSDCRPLCCEHEGVIEISDSE